MTDPLEKLVKASRDLYERITEYTALALLDRPNPGLSYDEARAIGEKVARLALADEPEPEQPPRPGYQRRDSSRCRGCGAPIIWWETPSGKLSPHDPDGTSHFATCPVQERFRQQKEAKP